VKVLGYDADQKEIAGNSPALNTFDSEDGSSYIRPEGCIKFERKSLILVGSFLVARNRSPIELELELDFFPCFSRRESDPPFLPP
jgi:hypothetical protein